MQPADADIGFLSLGMRETVKCVFVQMFGLFVFICREGGRDIVYVLALRGDDQEGRRISSLACQWCGIALLDELSVFAEDNASHVHK